MPDLIPVDLVRLEIHAEQNAHRYHGGPLNFSAADAVRYTAESWKLCDDHGLSPTWQAVQGIVDRRPEVLTSTPAQRAGWAAGRQARAGWADREALAAFKAADWPGVLAAVDRGEQADPDYRVGGWRTWDYIRGIVAEKQTATARTE